MYGGAPFLSRRQRLAPMQSDAHRPDMAPVFSFERSFE
jgi:hypothetical protein